jgi:sterol desaturase/sphingolipid hydroxylase (fatty acid hydroxylase superfamily)
MNKELLERRPVKVKHLLAAFLMFAVLGVIGFKYSLMLGYSLDQIVEGAYSRFYWLFIAALPFPIILYLNAKYPADVNQPLFSKGVFQDFAYEFLSLAARVSILIMMFEIAGVLHLKYLSSFKIVIPVWLPSELRVLFAFLFVDLLFYFDHRIRHKVSLFWLFHAMHHSQRELNYFTDSRTHVFDRVWSLLIVILPTLIFQLNAPQLVFVSLIIGYHGAIYHTNLKTNYGWLRYILVTPQSHRIHHSILEEHQNKNFGGSLSIWDHMFGTQYRNYDEYPETGVADTAFPLENGKGILNILDTFGAQFWYPFETILSQASNLYRRQTRS